MKFFILLFFFFSFFSNFSQTLRVEDESTGTPLESITLISYEPYVYTTTNSKGQANISEFKESVLIEISMLGYRTVLIGYDELKHQDFILKMKAVPLNMSEVVISATKWNQQSDNIPSKVIGMSLKEVLFQQPQTTADLLHQTGKVFIQKSQQGGGSPLIRGFATNRLLYSIDGIRMNTAIFRGGNLQNIISLDQFSIERTEVLFGPGSVIYGSDAIGGVMSFRTLTPQLSTNNDIITSGNALFRFATANEEKTGHFHLNYGGAKWAGVSSLSFNDFGDLKMGSYGPDDYLRPKYVVRENGMDVIKENKDPRIQTPSGYNQYNLMQKIRFKPNEKWDFNYGFHYSTTSEYARYDFMQRTKNGTLRYGEWNYGPQKWMMNLVDIENKSSVILFDAVNLKLSYQFFEESRISRNLNKTARTTELEKVFAYSGNLDFNKVFNKKNQFSYGIEYVLNHVNSTGQVENINNGEIQGAPSRYPESDWVSLAVYLMDSYKLSETINMLGGLRYNQYQIDAVFDTTYFPFPFTESNISNGALTGSWGLVYKPIEIFEVNFNASTAFRSPNVDDFGKLFGPTEGTVMVPNPNLKEEYAYNVDLGIASLINENVKAEIFGYYTYLKDALVRRKFTFNGASQIMYDGDLSDVYAIQNAANAKVWGIQGAIEVKLLSGLGFKTNANYQKGEEELDNGAKSPSRHVAPFFANAALNYRKNKINLQLNAVYNAEKTFEQMPEEEKAKTYIYALDANGNIYSPAWYTLNFKSDFQINSHLKLLAGVENITDQRYRPYSSGISGAGRNYIISVRTDF